MKWIQKLLQQKKQNNMITLYKHINPNMDVVQIYREYIAAINGLYKLSEKEKLVLALCCVLDSPINTGSRKKLKQSADIDDSGLSRTIKKLKHKMLLVNTDTGLYFVDRDIIPYLLSGREYDIKMNIEIQ
jgi:hypothetical protein